MVESLSPNYAFVFVFAHGIGDTESNGCKRSWLVSLAETSVAKPLVFLTQGTSIKRNFHFSSRLFFLLVYSSHFVRFVLHFTSLGARANIPLKDKEGDGKKRGRRKKTQSSALPLREKKRTPVGSLEQKSCVRPRRIRKSHLQGLPSVSYFLISHGYSTHSVFPLSPSRSLIFTPSSLNSEEKRHNGDATGIDTNFAPKWKEFFKTNFRNFKNQNVQIILNYHNKFINQNIIHYYISIISNMNIKNEF